LPHGQSWRYQHQQ